jgi:hypothetical protein
MNNSPQFGTRTADTSYKKFFDLSADAFAFYGKMISGANANDPLIYFYSRFGYLAQSTSWSIRLLTSWEATLPAVALARVRLEQVILCSYLIHEETHVALRPYLNHLQIEQFLNNKEAIKNPTLKPQLDPKAHEELQKAAIEAKKKIDASYDGSPESLNRSKWTRLDLLSMAKRRDVLTKGSPNICHHPLELSYLAFYRDFSSLVHSGGMALSPEFLAMVQIDEKNCFLAPRPVWSRYLMMVLATWDILQVFELLTNMQMTCEKELKELHDRWLVCRDEYFGSNSTA